MDCADSLWIPMQTLRNELLSLVGHSLKELGGKVQGGGGDVPQGLLVGLAPEGREARKENVGEHSEGPDIGSQADGLVGQDLRGCVRSG